MSSSSRVPDEGATEFYTPDQVTMEHALMGFQSPGFVASNETQAVRINQIRTGHLRLANLILHACPNSFEQDNALARLRESLFWAINSVCHE